MQEAAVTEDPYRGLKLGFKIDACYAVGLPLIVISFEEIETITQDDLLSVVNSMIGQHIASREYQTTIKAWDREGRGVGKSFDELLWETSCLKAELQTRYDPFLKKLVEIETEYAKLVARWSMSSVSHPDQMTVLCEKKHYESVGCKFTVLGGKVTTSVVLTVWVRNFAGTELGYDLCSDFSPAHGINPLKVAENIAWYLSHKKAVESTHSL